MNPSRTRQKLARAILGSRRRVTILFTDVEGSTALWEKRGDVEGRILVDQHNRLVFPLIRRFRGHVVKTIGDSVMAWFKRADDAVRAAIAIQQSIQALREEDPDFEVRVRIGIHSGPALVEQGDVFGDVVNTAARVESRAAGDQILVSSAAARGLDRAGLRLVRAGSFKPKGKRRTIGLYAAQWKQVESLVVAPTRDFLPVYGRQRIELAAQTSVAIAACAYLYHAYARYLIADSEQTAAWILAPQTALGVPLVLLWIVGIGGVAAAIVFARLRRVPRAVLGCIHATSAFCIGFGLVLGVSSLGLASLDARVDWDRPLFTSRHLFVEILEDGTLVREGPGLDRAVVRPVDAGALMLLAGVEERPPLTWNRVWMGQGRYGYVARAVPARPGAPRKRLSIAKPFVFSVRDACAWLVGGLAFALWYARFGLRPA